VSSFYIKVENIDTTPYARLLCRRGISDEPPPWGAADEEVWRNPHR